MKKTTIVIKFMVVIIILITVALLFRNCSKDVKQVNNLLSQSISDSIISEEELQKKQYENMKDVKRLEKNINSDTEIVLLTIQDNYVVSHEKVKKSFLGMFDSSVSVNIVYTAIISIPSTAIQIIHDESGINVFYDLEKIFVKSIEIEKITSDDKYGIFGEFYSHYEISALTLLATEYVREEIESNEILKFIAEQNLVGYLRKQAYSLLLFDIAIKAK